MTEMKDMFTEKELMCSNMGLCSATSKPAAREAPKQPASEMWKSMGMVKTSNGEELMSCFECTLSADALLQEFIDKRVSAVENCVANFNNHCMY